MLALNQLLPFSPSHIIALLAIAVLAVALVCFVRRAAEASMVAGRRLWVCRALAALLIANMLCEQSYELAAGSWSAQHSLPLHLCDIGVLVVALVLWTAAGAVRCGGDTQEPPGRRRQWLYEAAYYWGLGGAVQALLTPDVAGAFPAPHFFTYFLAHGSIVVGVLVLTVGLRMRPRRGSAPRVWLLTNVLAVALLPLNGLLGSNYMFVCGPPDSPTILDHLGAWPWPFLLNLSLVAAAGIALCYLPYWVIDRLRVGGSEGQRVRGSKGPRE